MLQTSLLTHAYVLLSPTPRARDIRCATRLAADGWFSGLNELPSSAAHARNLRCSAPRAEESGGWFSGLTDLFKDFEPSPEKAAVMAELCRPDGWDVRCEIGSGVAKSVGGSGALAKANSQDVRLELSLALDQYTEERYQDPPQGALRFLRASRFFEPESSTIEGFFKIEADNYEGVPTYVQWRTKCLGIESVGLPAGSLYFNAKIVRDGDRCTLEAGRLTVKEEIGVNTPLFPTARGILAEFKIVGTFEARPRAAVAAPGS